MPNLFPYSQFEIESAIDDLVTNGQKKQIAALMDVSEGLVSSFLNPDDDRKSPFFNALKFQFAVDSCGIGAAVMSVFNSRRKSWLPERRNNLKSSSVAAQDFRQRVSAFIETRIADKSHNEQINDLQAVIDHAEQLKQSIIAERNAAQANTKILTYKQSRG